MHTLAHSVKVSYQGAVYFQNVPCHSALETTQIAKLGWADFGYGRNGRCWQVTSSQHRLDVGETLKKIGRRSHVGPTSAQRLLCDNFA